MKEEGSTGLNWAQLAQFATVSSTGCPLQPSSLVVKWLADGSRYGDMLGQHGAK